ncbi:MAG: Hint domain-containing protein [Pseudomonadota bacterium]
MVDNTSSNSATEDDQTFSGSSGDDTLTGGLGDDTILGSGGNDTLSGDGPVPGTWHFEAFNKDFSSAAGQAFTVEDGTREAAGYVSDFDVDVHINDLRGTGGNPEDFGFVYTTTLNVTTSGDYRFFTRGDDGSTIQIFDSSGTPVLFDNQTGGTLDYMNNDFHQAPRERFGDTELDGGETYTIQVRYWENRGQNELDVSVQGPDTGGAKVDINDSGMLGLPPGPDFSVTGVPAGIEGADSIDGGAGDDVIDGGGGDDRIAGGTGSDTLSGGVGNDTFVYSAGDGDDVITDFGDGVADDGSQLNNDFIDLNAFYTNLAEMRIDLADDQVLNQSVGDYSDNAALGGSLSLTGISGSDLTFDTTNVACFAEGTAIETDRGPRRIETLGAGDLVWTLDAGYEPVLAVISQTVDGYGALAPVVFAPGILGNAAALAVSPNHRMVIGGWRAEMLHGEPELLCAAKHLVDDRHVRRDPRPQVTYYHLLFASHQIVRAEGALSESYDLLHAASTPGEPEGPTLLELRAIFPDLDARVAAFGPLARPELRSFEGAVLAAE